VVKAGFSNWSIVLQWYYLGVLKDHKAARDQMQPPPVTDLDWMDRSTTPSWVKCSTSLSHTRYRHTAARRRAARV